MKWYEKQKHMFEQSITKETPTSIVKDENTNAVNMEPTYTENIEETVVQNVVRETVNHYVPEVPQVEKPRTYIAEKTLIVGNIETDCDLTIYGHVKGDIECINCDITVCGEVEGKITCENAIFENAIVRDDVNCRVNLQVDSGSAVNGNIAAGEVYVNGKIKGDIKVNDIIHLGSSSVVIGSISAADIEIERGSIIQGGLMIRQEYNNDN